MENKFRTENFVTSRIRTADGIDIAYDHYQRGHEKLIIIAHGFFNSKQAVLLKQLAADLSGAYDVAALDFRGHGKSSGLFCWTAKEYLDLKALLDHLRPKYKKVGVIGFSLGAAIAMITASRYADIDSIIAVSPPAAFWKIENCLWQLDFKTDILYHYFDQGIIGQGCRPGPLWLKKDRPIDLVPHLKIPICYIHGEKDWLIKPWHSKALYEKTTAVKKLAIIKNGPHAEYLILRNHDEFLGLARNWFNETLVYWPSPY